MTDRTAVRGDWTAWRVSWAGVIVGGIAAVVAVVLFGLIGTAIGANGAGDAGHITQWSGVGFAALAYAVISSFFAFVIAGWIAGKLAGIPTAEEAALHGALAWLVGVFLIVAMAAFSGAIFSGWYSGVAPIAAPAAPGTPVDPNLANAIRNGALAAAASLLIGLMGSVIGGWVASGEEMTFGGYRVRLEPPGVDRTRDRTQRIG